MQYTLTEKLQTLKQGTDFSKVELENLGSLKKELDLQATLQGRCPGIHTQVSVCSFAESQSQWLCLEDKPGT